MTHQTCTCSRPLLPDRARPRGLTFHTSQLEPEHIRERLFEALIYSAQPLLPDRARPRGPTFHTSNLAREDARGPAEEFEWGKGRSQRNRHQRVMKLNEFERRACVAQCLEIETSLAKLSLTSLRRSSA